MPKGKKPSPGTFARIRRLFTEEPERMAQSRDLALQVDRLYRILFPVLDQHAALACPECDAPCCLSKEAYFQVPDLLFICALGYESPETTPVSAGPGCRFLVEGGCLLPRRSRPFGCNQFLCEPMKDRIDEESAGGTDYLETLFSEIRVLRRQLQNVYLGSCGEGSDAL